MTNIKDYKRKKIAPKMTNVSAYVPSILADFFRDREINFSEFARDKMQEHKEAIEKEKIEIAQGKREAEND